MINIDNKTITEMGIQGAVHKTLMNLKEFENLPIWNFWPVYCVKAKSHRYVTAQGIILPPYIETRNCWKCTRYSQANNFWFPSGYFLLLQYGNMLCLDQYVFFLNHRNYLLSKILSWFFFHDHFLEVIFRLPNLYNNRRGGVIKVHAGRDSPTMKIEIV